MGDLVGRVGYQSGDNHFAFIGRREVEQSTRWFPGVGTLHRIRYWDFNGTYSNLVHQELLSNAEAQARRFNTASRELMHEWSNGQGQILEIALLASYYRTFIYAVGTETGDKVRTGTHFVALNGRKVSYTEDSATWNYCLFSDKNDARNFCNEALQILRKLHWDKVRNNQLYYGEMLDAENTPVLVVVYDDVGHLDVKLTRPDGSNSRDLHVSPLQASRGLTTLARLLPNIRYNDGQEVANRLLEAIVKEEE